MGAMSVISGGFLALLGVATAVAWLAFRQVRRTGRPRSAVIATALFALMLTLALSADVANAHYEYLPRLADLVGERTWPTAPASVLTAGRPSAARAAGQGVGSAAPATPATRTGRVAAARAAYPRGAVVALTVPDAGVGFDGRRVLAYLPPQYFTDSAARFPVVYLLHGSPGVPVDWLRAARAASAGLAAALARHPQILVMPPLSRHWHDDPECVNGKLRVEQYVVNDVIPSVDAQLRTKPDRAFRTAAGMSAGGFCALNLGLRNRTVFGSIIDMSGFTHPTHSHGMTALFGRRGDLARLVAANSPDLYAGALSPAPRTRLYFACGTHDQGALRQMQALRDVLRAKGFSVVWTTAPGGHTYRVWRPALVAALAWAPN